MSSLRLAWQDYSCDSCSNYIYRIKLDVRNRSKTVISNVGSSILFRQKCHSKVAFFCKAQHTLMTHQRIRAYARLYAKLETTLEGIALSPQAQALSN